MRSQTNRSTSSKLEALPHLFTITSEFVWTLCLMHRLGDALFHRLNGRNGEISVVISVWVRQGPGRVSDEDSG